MENIRLNVGESKMVKCIHCNGTGICKHSEILEDSQGYGYRFCSKCGPDPSRAKYAPLCTGLVYRHTGIHLYVLSVKGKDFMSSETYRPKWRKRADNR